MDNNINVRISDQNAVVSDLQNQINQEQDQDKKQSLILKLNVARAKLAEMRDRASKEEENKVVDEEAPQQKKDFLDTDNNGDTIVQDPENEKEEEIKQQEELDESKYTDSLIADLRKRIERAMKQRDMTKGDARDKWQEGINDMRKEIRRIKGLREEALTEGCMSKKFEGMTNREIANYIFRHPHTKFGDKMKECDTIEMMKAIRDMKKANEETTTAAVATADMPSMYMERPKKDELKEH